MAITRSAMVTAVRLRLGDKATRPDGTAITPEHPSADVQTAINDVVRERQPDIRLTDPTWYKTRQTYTGVTDAVSGTSNEQYTLPTSPAFKDWIELRRTDLSNYPLVPLVDYDIQDARRYSAFFQGFYAAHPESLAPNSESAALITSIASNLVVNRFRILPAPAATSYTYALWYTRKPVEPSDDAHNIDVPDEWREVVALDAALYLASTLSEEAIRVLSDQRDKALAARFRDTQGRDGRRAVFGKVRM